MLHSLCDGLHLHGEIQFYLLVGTVACFFFLKLRSKVLHYQRFGVLWFFPNYYNISCMQPESVVTINSSCSPSRPRSGRTLLIQLNMKKMKDFRTPIFLLYLDPALPLSHTPVQFCITASTADNTFFNGNITAVATARISWQTSCSLSQSLMPLQGLQQLQQSYICKSFERFMMNKNYPLHRPIHYILTLILIQLH